MVENAEAVLALPAQRRLKKPQWIVGAEECGNIHVHARLGLTVEIIADVNAVADRGTMPQVHLLAIKTARPHSVKEHTFAIGIRVQGKVLQVIIVARAVIRAELMGLHAAPQEWKRVDTKGICLNACWRSPWVPILSAEVRVTGQQNKRQ